jgi:lipoate-protein ligase A
MKNELWQILDTGCNDASINMECDASLLERAREFERPILNFYEWDSPSATFGHFIDPTRFFCPERKHLKIARRPTGGGIIFHIWDMAFSVVVPAHLPEYSMNTLDNYAFVNQAVREAVQDFMRLTHDELMLIEDDAPAANASCGHFCMAKPTKYDVLLAGKKVAGAAQRKTKQGFLHQGSISLVLPDAEYLARVLLPDVPVVQAMQQVSCPLLHADASGEQIAQAKAELRVLLATHLNGASLKYRD